VAVPLFAKPQIMPFLRAQFPSFQPSWAKHVEDWDGEEAGAFNDITVFVRFVIAAFESGDIALVRAAFDSIEQLLREGDQEVRDISAIGFLEDVQILASHKPFGKQAFVEFLGTLSMQAWAEIEEMWRGKRSLADVVRAEVRAAKKDPSDEK
jgi:hypothetical protein